MRTIVIAALSMFIAGVAACGASQTQETKQAKPRVIIQDSSILIVNDFDETIPIEIPFGVDSDVLEKESYSALDVLSNFLKANLELDLIEVQGHSDRRGTPDHNLDLSERRAKSVVNYLVRKGIVPSRLRSEGFGSKRPAATGTSESSWSQNRRVEFVIIRQTPIE